MTITKDYSLDALTKFLDYAADKGLIKTNTAVSRKLAASKILSLLEDNEKENLKNVDLDHAFERFSNLQGTSFTPSSLKVYQSRTRTAVKDFLSYVEDPASFKPKGIQRSSPRIREPIKKTVQENIATETKTPSKNTGTTNCLVIPVPLRADLTVELHNIPPDLTQGEADKLSAIVKAYIMQ